MSTDNIEVDPYDDGEDGFPCPLRNLDGTCFHPNGKMDCYPHTCPLRKRPLLIKCRRPHDHHE